MKKGEKMSEEQKKKISKTHKSFGKNHWTKRISVREKMSLSHKGQTAWNKGKPAPWAKGFPKGNKPWNTGEHPKCYQNENHPGWKGDKVGYAGIHRWVERKLGKPKKCDDCGTNKRKMYHWANVSGEYKRDLKDWLRLCVSCHHKLDKNRRKLAFIKNHGK